MASPDGGEFAPVPAWLRFLAVLLPIGILGQFLSAGLGLFLDDRVLGLHGALGTALSLPVLGLAAGIFAVRRLRRLGAWMAPVLLLYLVQIALAAGGAGLPLALHPANGGLLLCASLVLLSKVMQGRRRPVAAPSP